MLTYILAFVLLFILLVYLFLQLPLFGKAPSAEQKAYYNTLPNYKNGKFQNYSHTPNFTEGYTMAKVMRSMLFERSSRKTPEKQIPVIKTNLHELPLDQDVLVWFGHSSYYLQIDGKRILVDPVFSTNASPIAGTNKAFEGTSIYSEKDIPALDYLFITHDHYDHLDYSTIRSIQPKVAQVICGLGVGNHLIHWGYDKNSIVEKNWHENLDLETGFRVHVTPARHFSGRKFDRNNTLWVSYVLQTPSHRIFLGGDSGYDTHFKEIGQTFGPFDLAILENGQYNAAWKYHHSHPEEVVKAAQDLMVRKVFPVHSGKFALANHAWDEPLNEVSRLSQGSASTLITPMIGEPVYLKNNQQEFKTWWRL